MSYSIQGVASLNEKVLGFTIHYFMKCITFYGDDNEIQNRENITLT